MAVYFALFFLSAIGISESVYLIKQRKASRTSVCFLSGDCSKVLESKYNKTLGVHNDVLGLFFYIAAISLVSVLVLEIGFKELISNLLKIMIFSGLLMSAYFTYLQWRVIKEWCFWCLISAAVTFLMAIAVLFI